MGAEEEEEEEKSMQLDKMAVVTLGSAVSTSAPWESSHATMPAWPWEAARIIGGLPCRALCCPLLFRLKGRSLGQRRQKASAEWQHAPKDRHICCPLLFRPDLGERAILSLTEAKSNR